jgi:hypothetical protein
MTGKKCNPCYYLAEPNDEEETKGTCSEACDGCGCDCHKCKWYDDNENSENDTDYYVDFNTPEIDSEAYDPDDAIWLIFCEFTEKEDNCASQASIEIRLSKNTARTTFTKTVPAPSKAKFSQTKRKKHHGDCGKRNTFYRAEGNVILDISATGDCSGDASLSGSVSSSGSMSCGNTSTGDLTLPVLRKLFPV